MIRYPSNARLKVGDLVKIKPTTELKDRKNLICFVEQLLGNRFARGKPNQEQVSLYTIDGVYVGDWFEFEFEELGRKITEKELLELIEKFKDEQGKVKDFQRVMEEIKKEKEK